MKIYSKFEYKGMLRFQAVKDDFLYPITKRLLRLHISPNFVSFFSGAVALLSLFLAIKFNEPLFFIIGIWIHFFLDNLDGSLARVSGKRPDADGVAVDLFFDSIGIVAVGLYILHFNLVSVLGGLIFITSYSVVNIISYIFAISGREYIFVVRPRIFVLIAIAVDYLFLYSITPIVILISNILLISFVLIGIQKLLKK